jgi:DNA helicase II / ATP-dependent DNA helicase PcrA
MLLTVLRNGLRPQLDVIIKDEAQDSSPLLFKVLDQFLQGGVQRCYIAGDPDQAIFTWQGANPALLGDRPCDRRTVLAQSHRLPRRVHALAREVLSPIEYFPRDAEGVVDTRSLSYFLGRAGEYPGTVFILVRNRYLLQNVINELYLWGLPFENLRGETPCHGKDGERVLTARRLLRGETITADQLRHMLTNVHQKGNLSRGFKAKVGKIAAEAPDRTYGLAQLRDDLMPAFLDNPMAAILKKPQKAAFFKRVIEHQGEEALTATPRITLGTIHAVKGMEADWVVILNDMSRRTWEGSQKDPLDEARVWYTGATRARQGLIFAPASGPYCWKWPRNGGRYG